MSDHKPITTLAGISKNFVQQKMVNKYDKNSYGQEEPFNPVRGEIALWKAVIMQALVDASSRSAKWEARQQKVEALSWLRGTSRDFITVCQLAEMDPDYVRKMARLALERGCHWRAQSNGGSQRALLRRIQREARRRPVVAQSISPPLPTDSCIPMKKSRWVAPLEARPVRPALFPAGMRCA